MQSRIRLATAAEDLDKVISLHQAADGKILGRVSHPDKGRSVRRSTSYDELMVEYEL